jgi:hypothetical protein
MSRHKSHPSFFIYFFPAHYHWLHAFIMWMDSYLAKDKKERERQADTKGKDRKSTFVTLNVILFRSPCLHSLESHSINE